jgi:NAD(P)-dependent dehydrogenase (short-subunit alcohol dehydrogenase family)
MCGNGELMRFSNKTVIITGATGGIGQACARGFAREGARLLLVDLNSGPADALAAELRQLGAPDVMIAPCDVSDEVAVSRACQAAEDRFGTVDVVVNIAGAMIYKTLDQLVGADWQRIMAVNFMGAVHFTHQAFCRMASGGAIVNVASVHARQTSANVAPYAAAKAALESLTRSSAIEGKARGIRANAVLPGAVDTPMLWSSPNLKSGAEVLAPEDVGKPDDIAAAVLFLASDEAAFITGASLLADGGRLAKL